MRHDGGDPLERCDFARRVLLLNWPPTFNSCLRLQLPADGRQRVVIASVAPEVDGGRFAIKRTVGETVKVQTVVFADGHESIACDLLYWDRAAADRLSVPMTAAGNDCWEAEFPLSSMGRHLYTVRAWPANTARLCRVVAGEPSRPHTKSAALVENGERL